MNKKSVEIRNYMLDILENELIKENEKLPGARQITSEIGVSFLKVQETINQLVQSGVLVTLPKRGTFVSKGWRHRILQSNFCTFKRIRKFSRNRTDVYK